MSNPQISQITQTVKVFKLNDFDWWAGYDLESVKEAYMQELELSLTDEHFEDARELTDEEMDRLHFVDGDDPINADGTPGGILTFRDALKQIVVRGDAVPCFFASTEW